MQSERMKHESTKENGTTLMSKDKLNKALIYGAFKPLPNPFLSTLDMPAAPLGTAQIKPNGSLIHRLSFFCLSNTLLLSKMQLILKRL